MGTARRVGRLGALLAGATVLGLLVPAAPARAQEASTPEGTLSPEVLAQIDAILADKESRNAAEQKLDDSLLYASREQQGEEPVDGVPDLQTSAEVVRGLTEVDIDGEVTPELLGRIDALGGRIVVAVVSAGHIRARIPLSAIEPLSQEADVERIRTADQAVTNRIEQVVGSVDGPMPNAGTVTSQADVTHAAASTRSTYGVDGTGIQIGVLSDGVNTLATRQASGDLPATVTVLPGQAGAGDEGTAMLELVHDLAPGAELFFATALGGQPVFAANILALRAAGCDIIVDDITYFAEAVFQPGVVEQAVDSVVASGAVYFSSAGNSGNLADGTSGAWTGDYLASGSNGGNPAYEVHDFSPAAGVQDQNQLSNVNTVDGSVVNLTWADPLGGSANDYDLFIINAAGNAVFNASTLVQNGDDNPIEQAVANANGQRVVIARKVAAAPRYLSVVTNRARFAPGGPTPAQSFATTGNGYGHNVGANTISLAATPVATAFGAPGSPTGPFPNPHTATNTSEIFSSDGPRRNFYTAAGAPLTPGNFGSTGGGTLLKPDLTAGDGATTTTPGFIPFFGTSASAPHAAAIAALMLDANAGLTPAQVKTAMTSTAIDIETVGADPVTGAGIVMANTAVASVALTGQAQFSALSYSAGEAVSTATITVDRVGGAQGAASVQVAVVAGGTATGGGTDFTYSAAQTVNWADGDSASKTVSIGITQDAIDEPNETVNLALQNPTTVTLGSQNTATLTIVDDDEPAAAGAVQFNVSTSVISEAAGTAVLTVNRVGGSTGAGTVQVARTGGTAVPITDFAFTSPTTVNFANGQTTATATVAITNDIAIESPDTISFALQNPTGGLTLGSPSTQTLTIVDNDGKIGNVAQLAQFSVTSSTVTEGNPASIQINRTNGTTGAVSVQVARTGGTATTGSDLTFSSPQTVSFAHNQATATLVVPTVEDLVTEPTETVQFTLQNPTGAMTLGSSVVHELTITDDDVAPPTGGTVAFSNPLVSVSESGGTATLTVTRTGTTTGAASVQVALAMVGTATGGGVDYTFSSPQTVNWADGEGASKTVSVAITGDLVDEPDETVGFVLQNPVTAVIGAPNATVLTILDDDLPPPNPGTLRFSVSTSSVTENGGPVNLTIHRDGGTVGAVSVQVARVGGSATPGNDFTFASPVTVNFIAGQATATVPVGIVDDALTEASETVSFSLQNPTGGAAIGSPASSILTIIDNDGKQRP